MKPMVVSEGINVAKDINAKNNILESKIQSNLRNKFVQAPPFPAREIEVSKACYYSYL